MISSSPSVATHTRTGHSATALHNFSTAPFSADPRTAKHSLWLDTVRTRTAKHNACDLAESVQPALGARDSSIEHGFCPRSRQCACRNALAFSAHREFIAWPSPHSFDERVDRGQQLRWRRGQVEGVAVDGDVGADNLDRRGGGVAFRVDQVTFAEAEGGGWRTQQRWRSSGNPENTVHMSTTKPRTTTFPMRSSMDRCSVISTANCNAQW